MNATTKSPATKFLCPPDAAQYIERVRARAQNLVDVHIWLGLSVSRLNQWWSNFATDEEKYFAACLLDSLIYRSKDQTISLARHLIQRGLPDLGRSTKGITDWSARLYPPTSVDTRVRLVPVIPPTANVTKSGQIIQRLLHKDLRIPESLFTLPDKLTSLDPTKIDSIVFIDDFLGTGSQFIDEFFDRLNLAPLSTQVQMIYAPLVAHVDGVARIRASQPTIQIAWAELLDSQHALFGDDCQTFADSLNTPRQAWEFYKELVDKRGICARRGFGDLELAYFFEHSAPDNCLPIFWYAGSPAWKPLFPR